MSVTVLPLKGLKSLRALNAFHTMVLGLKFLPMNAAKDYGAFLTEFDGYEDGRKETLIRHALAQVELKPDELEACLSFTTDNIGVPIGPSNIKGLGLNEIFERLIAVFLVIEKIKVRILSEDEQKKNKAALNRLTPDNGKKPDDGIE